MNSGIENWKAIVARYQKPSNGRALWQASSTLLLYSLTWYLLYLSIGFSAWWKVPLVLLGGGLLVRLFIIFHDCGHSSFFSSPAANHLLGCITGVLTLTPYFHWRWEHAIHHATSGDLDRRGTGDVWTMTVEEYLAASRWKKLAYRFVRNPIILFGVAPIVLFVIRERFPTSKAGLRERLSVYLTNLALVLVALMMGAVFGLKTYLVLQLSMILLAGSAGVWLFYVQHQFEQAYWARREDWDYVTAALQGSSFYRLPKVLQWFSGNIGYHHIHHLSPRIPNYNLEKCHKAEPLFQKVPPVTLLSSLKCLRFRLWDEKRQRLVGFSVLRELRRRRTGLAAG